MSTPPPEIDDDASNSCGEERLQQQAAPEEEMQSAGELIDEDGCALKRSKPRKPRVLKDWQVLGEWNRDEYDTDDIQHEMEEMANNELDPFLSASVIKILKPNDKNVGNWRYRCSRTWKSLGDGTIVITEYSCPFQHRCNCNVSIRVAKSSREFILSISGKHDRNSHSEDGSKFLTLAQKGEIAKLVRSNPIKTSGFIRRELKSSSPEKAVGVELASSVRRYIRKQRKVNMEAMLDEGDFDGSYGSLMRYANKYFLPNLLKR